MQRIRLAWRTEDTISPTSTQLLSSLHRDRVDTKMTEGQNSTQSRTVLAPVLWGRLLTYSICPLPSKPSSEIDPVQPLRDHPADLVPTHLHDCRGQAVQRTPNVQHEGPNAGVDGAILTINWLWPSRRLSTALKTPGPLGGGSAMTSSSTRTPKRVSRTARRTFSHSSAFSRPHTQQPTLHITPSHLPYPARLCACPHPHTRISSATQYPQQTAQTAPLISLFISTKGIAFSSSTFSSTLSTLHPLNTHLQHARRRQGQR